MFTFEPVMTSDMQLEENNTQVGQRIYTNCRSYMSPCVPIGCVSSVTIQFIAEGETRSALMFGISKQRFTEGTYLGSMKQDWSIDLHRNGKYNDAKCISYEHVGMAGDTFKCEIDRNTGSVRFYHNDQDLGKAFQNDDIKEGTLHFAVSC